MGRKFNIYRQLGFIWLAVSCIACEPQRTAFVATDSVANDVVLSEDIKAPNVRILPERPTSRDALTAQLLSPEAGAQYHFRWIVNGELLDDQIDETLPGGTVSRGQSVVLEVSASRDGRTSPWGGASVVIGNAAPVCLRASILPNPPTIFDSIECRCDDLDDPDDDLVDTLCLWSDLEPTLNSCSRPAPHNWLTNTLLTCELTVIDSRQDAGTVIASSMVVNTPPTGGQVGLQPAQVFEDSQVRCLASGATDPDGVSWNYDILVDGLLAATGPDVEINGNSFDKGQSIQCIATATDGIAKGQPIASETVVVGDSPASVVAIQATPPVVTRLQTPSCDITMTDPDLSDIPESVTTWWRNGVVLDWEPASPLGNTVVPGDTIFCSATPLDYPVESTPKLSNNLLVKNLGPDLAGVDILPEAPTISDVLTCVPYAHDPEGDPMVFSYSWSVDGAQITDAGATLSGITAGSLVQCEVQVSDAYGDTASMASSTVAVVPSPPHIEGVAMLPTTPGPCDSVSCIVNDVSDPDGTSNLTIATTLLLNGVPTSETTFAVGAELQCIATITDETGLNVTASSTISQVTNTPPTLSAVTISPAQPTAGDTLT
ncbi:MAG: hypothetical protein VX223_15915, partial [Myxococcota bacterium]|nr:hypothetical protein [Myxococcota bacterium]